LKGEEERHQKRKKKPARTRRHKMIISNRGSTGHRGQRRGNVQGQKKGFSGGRNALFRANTVCFDSCEGLTSGPHFRSRRQEAEGGKPHCKTGWRRRGFTSNQNAERREQSIRKKNGLWEGGFRQGNINVKDQGVKAILLQLSRYRIWGRRPTGRREVDGSQKSHLEGSVQQLAQGPEQFYLFPSVPRKLPRACFTISYISDIMHILHFGDLVVRTGDPAAKKKDRGSVTISTLFVKVVEGDLRPVTWNYPAADAARAEKKKTE